jgi:hypothetical protein
MAMTDLLGSLVPGKTKPPEVFRRYGHKKTAGSPAAAADSVAEKRLQRTTRGVRISLDVATATIMMRGVVFRSHLVSPDTELRYDKSLPLSRRAARPDAIFRYHFIRGLRRSL